MSKQSMKIVDAFNEGMNDKRLKRPYNNKHTKRDKKKAYRNGYNAI